MSAIVSNATKYLEESHVINTPHLHAAPNKLTAWESPSFKDHVVRIRSLHNNTNGGSCWYPRQALVLENTVIPSLLM